MCPTGSGVQTTRFFETLYAGKTPVLIGRDWKAPFADIIDYNQFRYRSFSMNVLHALIAMIA